MSHNETEADFITREDNMERYVKSYKYLVIKSDRSVELYQSLRRIQKDILVDASTISKKIKESGGDHCICVSKPMNYVFYIKRLT